MIRRPPRFTLPDTLFPYTTLFRAGFIVAVHIPIAGLAIAPLLFGFPILLGPIHIALLEMVIDPVCSLVSESEVEERDIMRRPPREPASALDRKSPRLNSSH